MAYRDSTTNSGSSNAPSVAVPAGVAIGDIVILVAAIDSATANFQAGDWPTGFTELEEVDVTADGHAAAIGWKRLTAADSGSYTFGNVGASADWICQAAAFSGRHATNPPVASTPNIQNTPQTSPITVTATGVTAVDGDDLLWASAPDVTSSGAGNGHTAPTNFTEREDAENLWTNLSIATRDNVAAGATGNISGTFSLSQDTAGWAAFLVRIPAAPAGPETQFYTATITPAGALAQSVTRNRAYTATITPAGALARVASLIRAYVGTITPAGLLASAITRIRAYTATITPAGLLSSTKVIVRTYTGTITPAGALTQIKAALKSFTATITPAGALNRATSLARSYTATVTPAGAFVKVATLIRGYAATITPDGLLTTAASRLRAYTATVTPTGALLAFKVIVRAFTATITPAAAFVKIGIKGCVASIAPAGTLTKTAAFIRSFTATITPAGALFKTIFKFFTGLITAAGTALVGLFGVADRVNVAVSDRLKTQVAVADQAKTLATVSDRVKTITTVSDQIGN